ncbi:MAG: putative sulfate/molybdate transporter [Desulfobacterales bacterium]
MMHRYAFNRLELAGSLGDLGTLLPLAIGMILVNKLDPAGLFFSVGLYYILAGIYFGVTVPVQPMKVVGAYAIAMGLSASQILASSLWLGGIFIVIGATGAMDLIGRYTPKPVVRGVQLSTGALLMAEGVKFMLGTSKFQLMSQAAEPFLIVQRLGFVPVGIVIGVIGGLLTLLLLDNRKLPAGLLVVCGGAALGLILGTHQGFDQLRLGLHLPPLLPFPFPSAADFASALLILVLPQIPMTLGNAVIAYADLSTDYFGEDSRRVTYRAACISIAMANFVGFFFGGMPLCHGAGGLAAHHRFGARTAGSNLMIGAFFILLVVFFGDRLLAVLYLLPMSILGVLLIFAGGQLALTIIDLKDRKGLFVALMMLGITLASNLAAGFLAGLVIAYLLKSERLNV